MTLVRTRTTPETFEADFMNGDRALAQDFPAIKRQYMNIIQAVLRRYNEDPGGALLRVMVDAKEISLAEAVMEIYDYCEAEVDTDNKIQADPEATALEAEYEALPDGSHEPEHPAHEQYLDSVARCKESVRIRAIAMLRKHGEHAIADLAEFHPGTLTLLTHAARASSYRDNSIICPSRMEV